MVTISNIEVVESGGTDLENANAMVQMQILFKNNLYSNREYCLHIMLTDDKRETVYHYYIRAMLWVGFESGEKLKFVLDFNEATFNKDSMDDISSYLKLPHPPPVQIMSLVTLYSSADVVHLGVWSLL